MSDFNDHELEFPTDIDPSKIPTFTQLPLGRLEFELKSWKAPVVEMAGRDGSRVEKQVVDVQVSVVAVPPAYEGRYLGLPYTKRFFIGSDSDPLAKHPATWIANAGGVMALLKKAKVATSKGIKFSQMMDAAIGSHVLGEVKEAKKSGRHDVMGWLSVGEKPLEAFGVPAGAPMQAKDHPSLVVPDALASEFSNDDE